jgi:hypothetical protein
MTTIESADTPGTPRRNRLMARLGRAGQALHRPEWQLADLLLAVKILLTIGLGILITWIVVVGMGIHGDAIAIACLLIPPLVVLTFSGRLSEISAGGVTARFRKASRRPVRNLMARAIAPTLTVRKQSEQELHSWVAANEHNYQLPVVLSLRLGQSYDTGVFLTYLNLLSRTFPRFAFVAFLDQSGAHVCHTAPAIILARHAESDVELSWLLELVQLSDTVALLGTPGMQRRTVTSSTRLAKAIRRMKDNAEVKLLVVDSAGQPVGVLEQGSALSELVLSLI